MRASTARFRDRFLNDLQKGFQRRRKAISHHGRLEFHQGVDEDFEWLTIVFSAPSSPSVILQLTEGNRVNLYVRSTVGRSRGRVLVRVEDLVMINSPTRIVDAFEWTLSAAHELRDAGDETRKMIEARWRDLALHAF
jgi:hypothetical protein